MSSVMENHFSACYNDAVQLYDEDRLVECVAKCKEILNDTACPRYHHIKTLVLLGGSLGDWEDANKCYMEADVLWRITRRWESDADAKVQKALSDLREEIDELKEALREDQPVKYDAEMEPEAAALGHELLTAESEVVYEANLKGENEHDTDRLMEMEEKMGMVEGNKEGSSNSNLGLPSSQDSNAHCENDVSSTQGGPVDGGAVAQSKNQDLRISPDGDAVKVPELRLPLHTRSLAVQQDLMKEPEGGPVGSIINNDHSSILHSDRYQGANPRTKQILRKQSWRNLGDSNKKM